MRLNKLPPRFVLCVQTEDDADITLRKVYQVLPDKDAEDEGFLRIIDDSGEDYLYSADLFVTVALPLAAKRRLAHPAKQALDLA